jgi:TPR repeat protein
MASIFHILMNLNQIYLHLAVESLYLDDEISIYYLFKSIRLGNNNAFGILGFCCEFGINVQKCAQLALKFYRKCFESKSSLAYFTATRISFLRNVGRPGIVIDMIEGREMGFLAYRNGVESTNWLRYAARKNLPEAQYCLAHCYYKGIIASEQNNTLAYFWCKKAADRGLSQAENLLGKMYIDLDPHIGLEWYKKAAEQLEPSAMYNIGYLYAIGLAVPESRSKSVEWYTRAAKYHSVQANYALGLIYEDNLVANCTPEMAVAHYTASAVCGHSYAQYNTGRCYHTAFGVSKDNSIACFWFEKAAKHGHTVAQLAAAICHDFGFGVPKNEIKALDSYAIAAKDRSYVARKRLILLTCALIVKGKFVLFYATKSKFVALPTEIKLKILSLLNIENALSAEKLQQLTIANDKDSERMITRMENRFRASISLHCSCSHSACEDIDHIVDGLRDLEYDE